MTTDGLSTERRVNAMGARLALEEAIEDHIHARTLEERTRRDDPRLQGMARAYVARTGTDLRDVLDVLFAGDSE